MTTASHEPIQAVLVRHPEIRLAILFGSLATGKAGHESDVDLAVSTTRPMDAEDKMVLMADLAVATGRSVDLIDLDKVGEPVLGQILKYGKRLVGSDECYARLITRHLFDEADFMPYYRRMLAERRQAWIGR